MWVATHTIKQIIKAAAFAAAFYFKLTSNLGGPDAVAPTGRGRMKNEECRMKNEELLSVCAQNERKA